ncbi:MAG TPA: hypothetical protein VF794_05555 [Archangium sp.]|uniref:hypothetical protein n=1 Tax=Archangium sp. TaxID=1872627 RepID=UPI002EDAF433
MAAALRLPPPRGSVRQGLVVGVLALIVAEVVVFTLLSLRSEVPRLVHLAVVADVVLFTAAALWLVGGPRTAGLSAGKALRAAVVGVVLFSVGLRVVGVPASDLLLGLALAAEATLAAVVLMGLARALRQPGDTWVRLREALRESLPTPVAEVAFGEVRLMGAMVATLLRRPLLAPEPSSTVFVPMAASRTGWLIPVVILAMVVEGTAVHLLLYALGARSGWLHGLLLALNCYTVLWLMGDRRLMRQSAHRLEPEALELSLGLRFCARIPYQKLARVLPLRTDAERRSVQPRGGKKNPSVTPFEEPNVHLCLHEPVSATLFFGITRQVEHLDLFVERPEEFIAALTERTQAR